MSPRLSSKELEKIRRLHIRSRVTVDTLLQGGYRSAFRGQGMEFEEVREYTPGDETKRIDWNVTARRGAPYVKLYREERELSMMILVDMSASGLFGSRGTAKRDKILECAGTLGFSAIHGRDRVGAILFSDHIESYLPPRRGASAVWHLIRDIFLFRPSRRGTDLEEALNYLGRVQSRRSVVFIISDFLAQGYEKALRVAARKHDVIGVHITDPAEGKLPPRGIITLKDMETHRTVQVDARDARDAWNYEKKCALQREAACKIFESSGVERLEINTTESVGTALSVFFSCRERRRRH